jgi:Tol biopolymer transport system component
VTIPMTRWIIALYTLAAAALLIMSPAAFADTSKLVFVRGGNVWIANTDGAEARQLTTLEPGTYNALAPAISQNAQWVAFSAYRKGSFKQLYLLPSSGGTAKPLRPKGIGAAWDPSFSPDGKSLLFVGMSKHRIEKRDGYELSYATVSVSLMDLETGRVRQIVSHPNTFLDAGSVYANPSFSPDGQMIAYQHSGSDVSGGFSVVNRHGKSVFMFPQDPQNSDPYWRPQFFPDGKEILCYSPRTSWGGGSVESQRDNIYQVNMSTRQANRIAGGCNPTFVDGGKAIIYEGWPPGPREIGSKPDLWRLDLAPGAQPRKILTDAAQPAGQP